MWYILVYMTLKVGAGNLQQVGLRIRSPSGGGIAASRVPRDKLRSLVFITLGSTFQIQGQVVEEFPEVRILVLQNYTVRISSER